MSEDLDDLACAGADALVSAMMTDSWSMVKRRFAALVGHERRMDVAQAALAATSGANRDRARLTQGRVWSTRLRDVLDDDPTVADGLRRLLADLDAAPPAVLPASQHTQANHASQAINVGGNISGNNGEVYVGVGKVDKRKFNIVLAPFIFLLHAGKKIVTAYPLGTTAAATVVIAATAVTGWRTHWPPAIFGGPAPQPSLSSRAAQPSSSPRVLPAGTKMFPDGTEVKFVSAKWTLIPNDNEGGPAVKFTFRIVAGPGWKQDTTSHPVKQLRPCSGDGRPLSYYKVTVAGWTYPNYNSTGYADISKYVQGPSSGGVPDQLIAGDSVNASSILATGALPPNPQHVVVTIMAPNGKLQSRSFAVNVDPRPSDSRLLRYVGSSPGYC